LFVARRLFQSAELHSFQIVFHLFSYSRSPALGFA
jgi:hypothetical protein